MSRVSKVDTPLVDVNVPRFNQASVALLTGSAFVFQAEILVAAVFVLLVASRAGGPRFAPLTQLYIHVVRPRLQPDGPSGVRRCPAAGVQPARRYRGDRGSRGRARRRLDGGWMEPHGVGVGPCRARGGGTDLCWVHSLRTVRGMSADIVLRLALLGVAVGLAWLLVRLWERRLGRGGRVAPGVTIIVTPTCLICPDTMDALLQADPAMKIRVLDATEDDVAAYAVQSAPTVVVADAQGQIQMRRSGRSTINDASEIAVMARQVTVAA